MPSAAAAARPAPATPTRSSRRRCRVSAPRSPATCSPRCHHRRARRTPPAPARAPRDRRRHARPRAACRRRGELRPGGRRLRDLRRRPAPPLREPRRRAGSLHERGLGRPQEELTAMAKTLFDKIWDTHEVAPNLIYIDLHMVHEVTSPQAFDGLRLAGRKVRRPDRTLAPADHNVPTDGSTVAAQIRDRLSRVQVETLERNCEEFGVPLYSIGSEHQGIVHVIGPELGVTQPGMTVVCGDSHTATHGAFGALAFGIGTSEVEHVLATQTMPQGKPKSMRILYSGELGFGVTAKDLILETIGEIGVSGGVGYAIEYAGDTIEGLSMEGRMTICNMTIEAGGRAGMVAPDDTTFEWVEGRPAAPDNFPEAVARWRELHTDDGADFDHAVRVDATQIAPQ